jgi:hypothetical protein
MIMKRKRQSHMGAVRLSRVLLAALKLLLESVMKPPFNVFLVVEQRRETLNFVEER